MYFEYVLADTPELAEACKCDVGQTVARFYMDDGEVKEFKGKQKDAEKFVARTMKEEG